MSVRSTRRLAVGLAAFTTVLVAAGPAVARGGPDDNGHGHGHGHGGHGGHGGKFKVVAGGLANPRGITIGPDGALYVAEAGSGGAGPCRPSPEGGPDECVGTTGAITAIDRRTGQKRTVLDGLGSIAAQTGDDPGGSATGPQDVSFSGRRMWFVTGFGGNEPGRAALGEDAAGMGFVYRSGRGGPKPVADLVAYEQANDPDAGQPGVMGPDSNPFSIDATGNVPLVTDAGGNDLLRVRAGGQVSVAAVLPFLTATQPPFAGAPVQPVPTGVVRRPNGGAFLGQLTGFPFEPGLASVFRFRGGRLSQLASGFTNVVDVAIGPHGTRYALSISAGGLLGDSPAGALFRLGRDGTPHELAKGKLTSPSGMTVGRNGDVYVTNDSVSGTDGEVVRIRG